MHPRVTIRKGGGVNWNLQPLSDAFQAPAHHICFTFGTIRKDRRVNCHRQPLSDAFRALARHICNPLGKPGRTGGGIDTFNQFLKLFGHLRTTYAAPRPYESLASRSRTFKTLLDRSNLVPTRSRPLPITQFSLPNVPDIFRSLRCRPHAFQTVSDRSALVHTRSKPLQLYRIAGPEERYGKE